MNYQVGRIGRCVLARFEHGDAVLEGLSEIAQREQIRAAVFYLVGGIKDAKIVVGPEREELPPEPVWRSLDESHETVGIGTIFWHEGRPTIHFHGAYGKRDSVKAGCLRGRAETFIVLEAVILELDGLEATRETDPLSGMVLLNIGAGKDG
ncbi:MAG: DUF296 domain-containing protein [Syntrophorhabdales bacterium]|jgi:predicted DNA-binding protein with PD1-like motif